MWCSNAVVQAKQWVESALLVERVSGEMRPALDTTYLVDALYSSNYVFTSLRRSSCEEGLSTVTRHSTTTPSLRTIIRLTRRIRF